MEDDQKDMEDDQNKFNWKTTKNIQDGRHQNKFKLKTIKKIKMEDDQNKFK